MRPQPPASRWAAHTVPLGSPGKTLGLRGGASPCPQGRGLQVPIWVECSDEPVLDGRGAQGDAAPASGHPRGGWSARAAWPGEPLLLSDAWSLPSPLPRPACVCSRVALGAVSFSVPLTRQWWLYSEDSQTRATERPSAPRRPWGPRRPQGPPDEGASLRPLMPPIKGCGLQTGCGLEEGCRP